MYPHPPPMYGRGVPPMGMHMPMMGGYPMANMAQYGMMPPPMYGMNPWGYPMPPRPMMP